VFKSSFGSTDSSDSIGQGTVSLSPGADGAQLVVRGYFDLPNPPALITASGARIAAPAIAQLAGA
jgi:hypothetical protein